MSQQFSQNPPDFKITAPAKLNLCLDVIGKDQSGQHKIQTVFYELKSLSDELQFFEIPQSCKVSMVHGGRKNTYTNIPKQENLAYRALKLIKSRFNISQSVHIEITKNIPMASGLGGGSSNAAATLKALNQMWSLRLSPDELRQLGKELGMDVPFFIEGGVALGTNYGEKITQLPDITGIEFKICPRGQMGTAEAFAALDLSKCGNNKDKTATLITAIKSQDNTGIIANIHNDFETIEKNATKPPDHLTGSGPTTFIARLQA